MPLTQQQIRDRLDELNAQANEAAKAAREAALLAQAGERAAMRVLCAAAGHVFLTDWSDTFGASIKRCAVCDKASVAAPSVSIALLGSSPGQQAPP